MQTNELAIVFKEAREMNLFVDFNDRKNTITISNWEGM